MTRDNRLEKSVALLATGDEICVGDIQNTNSQEIALKLANQHIPVRMHMAVPDTIDEIKQAIHFLLTHHDGLIITGGLGPTSDDLTRFALAEVLQEELIFDTETWDSICQRLKKFGYDVPPESNRQQALFPQGAVIIPNVNGTASGCYIEKNNKIIFMLPGPPSECLPMLQTAIPKLIAKHFAQPIFHKNWFLLGVSEGQIAEELDALAHDYHCVTGYRLFYPYLEFKLQSQTKNDFDELVKKVEEVIHPFIIRDGSRIASDILREEIFTKQIKLTLHDCATYGALEGKLITPKTLPYLKFTADNNKKFHVEINGLKEYWQHVENATHTLVQVNVTLNGEEHQKEINVPFRGSRVIQYAVEFVCKTILTFTNESN